MAALHAVVFHEPKAGSTDREWEDGAGHDPGDPATGRPARLVLADGATEAYDSIRWVGQLVDSFLGLGPGAAPSLNPDSLDGWFGRMQAEWLRGAPATFGSIFEERKFRQDGSFATLLGCQVDDLAGRAPRWTAVALGDTVLFQVRGGRVVAQFPPLAADGFGSNPDGVFTQPAARDRMRSRLRAASGTLAVGDRLYLGTDAIAAWLVRTADARRWAELDRLRHPAPFRRLVGDARRAGAMGNDDVTLMRVEVTAAEPELLAVCR
jgi:hypothetical protein